MIETRKIAKVLKSKPIIEGAGVHLKRAFGFSQVPMLYPFLLLDEILGPIIRSTISKGFPGTLRRNPGIIAEKDKR